MALSRRTIDQLLSTTRLSGATYINGSGRMIGVDFATTSSQAAGTGSKSYTIGTNRGWIGGQTVLVTAQDGTANISMTGTVTSYDAATGALVLNITATGSDTSTTKTAWRIGYTGPRLDNSEFHDFATGNPRAGLLIEGEARTNGCQNGDATGATNGVLGSGGALPTNWTQSVGAALTWTIVGSGVDSATGIPYVDIRWSGTRSGANSPAIGLNSTTGIVSAPGELWCVSAYVAMVAGSMNNISNIQIFLNERNSGGSFLTNTNGQLSFVPTATMRRYSKAKTMINKDTARVSPSISLSVPDGSSCDITLRIGGVQVERIREPIRTGTCQAGSTSTTVVLDGSASSTDDLYNGLAVLIQSGTGNGQTKTITDYDGATKTATVDSSWTTTPDGTSTFVLYSTNAPSAGGASSYIPTRSVAETRAADQIDAANFVSLYGAVAEGTILLKTKNPSGRDIVQAVSPTYGALVQDTNNSIQIFRQASDTVSGVSVLRSSNLQASLTGAALADSSSNTLTVGFKIDDIALSVNGATALTDTSTPDGVPTPTSLRLGRLNNAAPNGAFMGWIQKLRVIPRKLTNSRLESLT